jgi:HECT-domain (ubiquitin-transferase)
MPCYAKLCTVLCCTVTNSCTYSDTAVYFPLLFSKPFPPPDTQRTGIDAGGLTREWYLVLSREIFNPNYALFTAAADGATFQPNPLSMINMNHLDYFKFVGRVIGKAICDGQLMDAHFTR